MTHCSSDSRNGHMANLVGNDLWNSFDDERKASIINSPHTTFYQGHVNLFRKFDFYKYHYNILRLVTALSLGSLLNRGETQRSYNDGKYQVVDLMMYFFQPIFKDQNFSSTQSSIKTIYSMPTLYTSGQFSETDREVFSTVYRHNSQNTMKINGSEVMQSVDSYYQNIFSTMQAAGVHTIHYNG